MLFRPAKAHRWLRYGESMRAKFLVPMILLGASAGGVYPQLQSAAAAQGQTSAAPESSGTADTKDKGAVAQVSQTAPELDEIIDRNHASLIRARSVVQVHPGPPFLVSIHTSHKIASLRYVS